MRTAVASIDDGDARGAEPTEPGGSCTIISRVEIWKRRGFTLSRLAGRMRLSQRWHGPLLAAAILVGIVGTAVAAEDDGLLTENAAPSTGWAFELTPFVWATGSEGNIGVAGLEVPFEIGLTDVLKNLEGAALLSLEARNGQWGVLFEGIYAKLGNDTPTPGPLFSLVDVQIEETLVDVALIYRPVDRATWSLDVLAGARYFDLRTSIQMTPDFDAIDDVSHSIVTTAAGIARDVVGGAVDDAAARIGEELVGAGADLPDRVRDHVDDVRVKLIDRISEELAERAGGRIGNGNLPGAESRMAERIREAIAEAARQRIEERLGEINASPDKAAAIREQIVAAAGEKLDQLKQNASASVRKQLNAAEAKLAGAIRTGMEKAAEQTIEQDLNWIDPFIGVRANVALSDRIAVALKGDIAGFGVGSEFTWRVYGGIRYRLSRAVHLEAGYRHMSIDYESGGLTYNMSMSGVLTGVVIEF